MAEPELMDRAEVEARLRRAGLSPSPALIDEIHQISGHIRESVRRIGTDRPMGTEPSATFRSPE
jgi:hypothetical protein